MKVFVVIVCLWTTALASLEPAGYRPPGSSTSAQYLPPHQQQHHQPGGHQQQQQQQHQQQHHHHQHDSHGSPAPSQPPPTPSSQYLPPGRPSSTAPPAQYLPPGPNYLPASDKPRPTGPPSRDYLPPAAQQPAVTPPPREYLPPRPDYLPPKPQFKPKPEYLPPPPSTAAPKPTSTTPAEGYLPPVAAPQPGHPGYGYSAEAARRGPAYNEQVTEAAKYDFEYRVSDEYGNDFGHKESREGLHTHGSYNVLLPDGRMQIVHYEADEHGFKPRISYEKVASVLGSKPVDGFAGYDSNANGLGHY